MDPHEFIYKRQSGDGLTNTGNDNNDDLNGSGYWWYSPTAYAIKWAVIAAIFLFFLVFFVGGYLHATRRMKKGLAPLRYHRWMLPRRHRLAFYQAHPEIPNPYARTAYYTPGYGAHGPAYPMGPYGQQYPPPPPAYGENDYVPPYPGPEGGSKVIPDQRNVNVTMTEQGQRQESGVTGSGTSHPGGDLGQMNLRS